MATGMPHFIQETHVFEFIQEELDARGWSLEMLAMRMGGDVGMNLLALQMLDAVRDPDLLLDAETDQRLASAFGVSVGLFHRLHEGWRATACSGEVR